MREKNSFINKLFALDYLQDLVVYIWQTWNLVKCQLSVLSISICRWCWDESPSHERRPPQHHTRLAVWPINSSTKRHTTAVDDDNDELTEQSKRDTSLMCCFFFFSCWLFVFSVIITWSDDEEIWQRRSSDFFANVLVVLPRMRTWRCWLTFWLFGIFFFFSSAVCLHFSALIARTDFLLYHKKKLLCEVTTLGRQLGRDQQCGGFNR